MLQPHDIADLLEFDLVAVVQPKMRNPGAAQIAEVAAPLEVGLAGLQLNGLQLSLHTAKPVQSEGAKVREVRLLV